jgi:N-acetylglutamate synthase-like GNAT family acetyltransferase
VIRSCAIDGSEDVIIHSIINDAAQAYKGIIPQDRFSEPYMSMEHLKSEVADGVAFWGYEDEEGNLIGVMGVQDKGDVVLIRHAYVRTNQRGKGIGSKLLAQLMDASDKPILIGTWASASWAISFYMRHGFKQVDQQEKEQLLRTYWSIPDRQIETSVVLCDPSWITS